MTDLVKTHMDKVCDTCGDIGIETTLVICTKCKIGCEHLYCMSKFCEVEPDGWCCEICRTITIRSSACALMKVSSKAVRYDLSIELLDDPEHLTDGKRFCKGARAIWHERPVEEGKTKYLWTHEIRNMPYVPNLAREKVTSITRADSFNMKKSNSLVGNLAREKVTSITRADSSNRKKSNPLVGNLAREKVTSITRADSSNTKKSNPLVGPWRQSSKRLRAASLVKGFGLSRDAKRKNLDPDVVYTVWEFYSKTVVEQLLPTDPATTASWIGTFTLKDDKKTSMRFQAHPASQGLVKIKEFSAEMPAVLDFELCVYENFLKTVFKGCDPDYKDIGLYFFPRDWTRLKEYNIHMEQLSGRYYLKTCIDGVELLVFTSRVLQKDCRERNKCEFLWGLFRRRHGKLCAAEEIIVVDMEVD